MAWIRVFLLSVFLASPASSQEIGDLLQGHLVEYFPESDGQFPSILAVPGCSGISLDSPATDRGGGSPTDPYFRRHYPAMAEILRSEGFGVFLLDYHSAEGVVSACQGEVPPSRIAEYVVVAAENIQGHERVDPEGIFVIGWSLGGAGLLHSLDSLTQTSVRVTAAFAVYPGCGGAMPWRSDFPVHFFLGEADDITLAETCRALAMEASRSTSVWVKVYPGAHHGFDIVDAPAEISTGRGTTIGYNEAAASDTWARIRAVLSGG